MSKTMRISSLRLADQAFRSALEMDQGSAEQVALFDCAFVGYAECGLDSDAVMDRIEVLGATAQA